MVATDLGSPDITESLAPLERIDAYEQWQKAEGAPIVNGFYIEDLNTVPLGPWPRKGSSVSGAFVNLEGTGGVNDMHLIELAPGGASDPERHIYESMIYVLSGRGSTQVWYSEDRKASFEWGPGSLFAVPINANYRIFNSSGVQSARYVAVTNAPTIVSLFHNHGFVFDNPYLFEDRFSGGDDYFAGEGVLHRGRTLETNFVPNVHTIQLHDWKARGGGGTNVMIELAQNSMGAHVSQFKPGTYKKAHRHGPGAHVIILDGVGFSLLWREGDETRQKCDWRPAPSSCRLRTGSTSTSIPDPIRRAIWRCASLVFTTSSAVRIKVARRTSASKWAGRRSNTKTRIRRSTRCSSATWHRTVRSAA